MYNYRLFFGWPACTIFIHKLCKTNEQAQRVSLFYTTIYREIRKQKELKDNIPSRLTAREWH